MNKDKAIGVIDSGVGGLTVVKEIMRQLPHEKIYYLGDTARCPYGPRKQEEVRQFTWDMVHYLLPLDLKLLVIACNTATAAVLDEMRSQLPIPVIGVIQPGARAALNLTKNLHIGVIGTEGTIRSSAYETALRNINSKVKVTSLACPTLVPLVESGQYRASIARKIVADALLPLKESKLDTLILGCTHYPLLEPIIQHEVGQAVKVISSGEETARETSAILSFHDLLQPAICHPDHVFLTTGSNHLFANIVSDWLGLESIEVKTILLGN